jgi:hypothetical protein
VPPELHAWVEKSLLSIAANSLQVKEMQEKLKLYLQSFKEKGVLWDIDWKNKPAFSLGDADLS